MSIIPSDSDYKSLVSLLTWRALHQADETAYIFLPQNEDDVEERITYKQLDLQARQIAATLLERGAKGERVLLCYESGLDYVAGFFGCIYADAVAVPAYPPDAIRPHRTMPRLLAIITNAQAHIALTSQQSLPQVKALFAEDPQLKDIELIGSDQLAAVPLEKEQLPTPSAEQLAFLMYTSGSTGNPKGVMVTHGNVMHNLSSFPGFKERPLKTIVCWVPPFHDLGLLFGLLHPLYRGALSVLMSPVTFAIRPYLWLEAISRFKATTACGPNFGYELCIKKTTPKERDTLDLSHWNMALNGAEPVNPETLERFAEVFGPCGFTKEAAYPSYGMAEGTATVTGPFTFAPPVSSTFNRRDLEKRQVTEAKMTDEMPITLISCGPSIPDQDIRIVNPKTLQESAPDETGEVWVSGPSIAHGYWQRPEETKETFEATLSGVEGKTYLRTGDLGFLRDGELYITGRLKDLIIIRGLNHHPEDIEATVSNSHAALRPGGGTAFSIYMAGSERLVLVQEVNPKAITSLKEIFGNMRQAVVEVYDIEIYAISLIKPGSLLKTSSGKVRRRDCRRAFLTGHLDVVGEWRAIIGEKKHLLIQPPPDDFLPNDNIRNWLINYFAARHNISPEEIDINQPFARYGMGSLEGLTLIHDLEQWLGRTLSPTLAWSYPTIKALSGYLAGDAEIVQQALAVQTPKEIINEPIAVVGISCRFPGGVNSPESLWELLASGGDTVAEISSDRWDIDSYYDPKRDTPGKMVTRWGSHIKDLDLFDAEFFGISPREASQLDPRQRLALEGAWMALEDAGIVPDSLTGSNTGVFIAVLRDDYSDRIFNDYSIVNAYSGSGTANAPVANRISYFLNLRGPSMVIDTACSGSLVAIHLACQSLLTGESSLALAGGVNIILEPDSDLFMSQAGIISETGRCRTFDSKADGIVRADGMGLLVLKPLSKAKADGDQIYAIIKGSAVNHDGRSNGLMAPSGPAQESLLRTAYRRANISPTQLQYIEAHGTATTLGDPIEVTALGNVLGPDYPSDEKCALGSIKSNIGHAEAAAGVAGVIKVIMAMKHRLLPPNLHFNEPNPLIPFDQLPLVVQQRLGPWPRPNQPLIAGVSGFGFSGANAHVVLESVSNETHNDEIEPDAPIDSLNIIPLSAKTEKALRDLARHYFEFITKNTSELLTLYDIGYTASVRRSHFDHRLVVLADSKQELAKHLDDFLQNKIGLHLVDGSKLPGWQSKLVFVFSGQGTQWVGMGRQLLETEPVFKATIGACDNIIQKLAGWSLLDILMGNDDPEKIDDTIIAQLAIFSTHVALAALWRSWGLIPDVVVGQSLGEVAAAHVSGSLSLEDALQVVYHRSRLMQQVQGKGLTAVVGLPRAKAELVILAFKNKVSVAGSSSPASSVISGSPEIIELLVESLADQGVFARVIEGVTIAFHSSQMDPLVDDLVAALDNITPQTTGIPLFSTVTGSLIDGLELGAAYWGRNLRQPFLFVDVIKQLVESGYHTYIEISPHTVLSTPIKQALTALDKDGTVLSSIRRNEPERSLLLTSLATLYTAGYNIDWRRLYPHKRRKVTLPSYPWQYEHYWLDQINWSPLSAQLTLKHGSEHPLLGEYTKAAVQPWQHFWEMDINVFNVPYFKDHQIHNLIVIPGAAYLEMALAAAHQAFGTGTYSVEQILFKKGIHLSDSEPQRIQVVLSPEMENEAIFQVFSQLNGDKSGEWIEHIQGIIRTREETSYSNLFEFNAVHRRCGEYISGESHYKKMANFGLMYGPTFQTVRELWRRDGEALSRIKIHESLEAKLTIYNIHPTVLDGCFQTVAAAIAPSDGGEHGFLPVKVDKLRIYKKPSKQIWCHAVLWAVSPTEPNIIIADLTVVNDEGELIAVVNALQLERMVGSKSRNNIEQWLYELEWQLKPLTQTNNTKQEGSWLIFTTKGQDEPLAKLLTDRGETCLLVHPGDAYKVAKDGINYWINPESKADYERLFKEALRIDRPPCRNIVHRWSQSLDTQNLDQLQILGPGSVLALTQALIEASLTSTPRLWLITQGTQAVTNTDEFCVAQSSLWGMGRVIANEHPEQVCTLIDLPSTKNIATATAIATEEALFAEIWANSTENQLALRGTDRYVARLARYTPKVTQPTQSAVKEPHEVSATAPFYLEPTMPGVLDSLTCRATSRHKPTADEVEVEVYAAGLNFKDIMLALGLLPPLPNGTVPLGLEGAGRVVNIGADVTKVKIGDEVLVGTDNCLSRYVITSQHLVCPKPKNWSFEQCATVPVAFGTTYYALNTLANLKKGERVLIHTASGAVGQAAIQLAKLVGAEIYATAGTEKKQTFLSDKLGIEHIFNSRTLDFAAEIMEITNGEGVDVVLNTLSGAGITKSLDLLKPYGRFLELGKRDIVLNNPLRMGALERNISYFVVDFNQMIRDRPERVGELIDTKLLPLFEDGRLKPIEFQKFPISQVSEAFRLMAKAEHIGKVVISLQEQAVAIAPPKPQPVSIKTNATYLITGGLGGLGRTVAEYLVEQGAKHIVLTSRKGREGLSPHKSHFIATLENKGVEVVIAKNNVSDQEDTAKLFAQIRETLPPLSGIIHSAGVLDDKLLIQMSQAQLQTVLQPKIQGTWNLHQLTQDDSLDFFVLFSSLASLLAPQGQANYAAGNAFVDAVAHYRQSLGQPALSINWGPWSRVGMAARQASNEEIAAGGVDVISPERGLEVLSLLMNTTAAQVAVANINWQQMRRLIPIGAEPPFLTDLLTTVATVEPKAAVITDFVDNILSQAKSEDRYSLLENHLQKLAAGVLHLDPSRVDARRPLNTFGTDSIMAMELKTKIEKSLGNVTISVANLLRGSTLADLTEQFLSQLGLEETDTEIADLLAEADELSNEELDALLEM